MVPLTNSLKHAAAYRSEPKFSWGPLVLGQEGDQEFSRCGLKARTQSVPAPHGALRDRLSNVWWRLAEQSARCVSWLRRVIREVLVECLSDSGG